jgi:hypothetical protein
MNIKTEAPERNNCRVLQLVEFQRHGGELLGKPTGVLICRMLISD